MSAMKIVCWIIAFVAAVACIAGTVILGLAIVRGVFLGTSNPEAIPQLAKYVGNEAAVYHSAIVGLVHVIVGKWVATLFAKFAGADNDD